MPSIFSLYINQNVGGNRSLPLRGDWEKVKENVMKDALIAKFTQNKDILEVLLSTGGKTLVEHTVNDTYLNFFVLIKRIF